MKEPNAHAVQSHRFIFVDCLGGQVILRRGSARARGSLHFFLAVLLRDDRQARWESGESVDMISVAMREDDGVHGFRRDLGDFGLDFLRRIHGRFCIDHDDARIADNDSRVSAGPSLSPVDITS